MDPGRSNVGNYKGGGGPGMYYSGPINNGYQARGEKVSRGPMAPAGSSGNMDIPQTSTKYMGDSQGGPISGASGNPGMMPKKSTNASDFPYQQPKPDGAKKMGGPGIGGFPPQGGQQSRGNPGQSSNYYQSGPSGQSGSSGNYAPTSNQYSRDMMGKGPKHMQKDSYNSYSRGNNYGSGYLEQQNYYEETGKSGSKGGSDKGVRLDGIPDVPVSLAVDGMDGGDQSRGGYQRNKKYDQDSKQMSGPLNNSSVGAPSSGYYNSSRRDNQRFDANAGPNKREKFPNKKKGNKHRPEQFQDEYVESIAEDQDSQALSQGLGDSKLMGSSTVISTHGATSVHNHQDKSRQTHPREKQSGPRDYPKKEDKITEQDARREELIRKFAHVPQFNHEVGPMINILNPAWFQKPDSNEYENYFRTEDVTLMVQRGEAFHGICKYSNFSKLEALIISENFPEPLVASGLHTNRVFEGCEIIFIPTSKNWKEKVRVYQNGSYGKGHQAGLYHGSSGEKAYLDMIPEPRGNLVYNNFLQSVAVISSSASETNQQKENGALSRQDSDSANQSIQNSGSLLQSGLIEVKVVFIKSHPLKNKEIVLKLYRDKNQTLMGESLTNPRSPPFIVEMNAQQGGPNLRMAESKLAVCRYNKWAKEKQYPFATCVALLTQDDGSMESQILQKEYDLQLPSYTPEQVQGLVVQMKEELTNSQTTMEQELLVRKDYRDRFVFSIESDYYENKEITFSIQTEGSTETELTVYVPDVKRFIPHDSELDKETRRRFKTCNLETRDYPMIPSEVSSLIDLSPEQERLALAITIKIDPNESTPVSIDKPAVVEKCIIKSRHKLSYPDCYRILEMKSREDLIEHFPQHKLSKMLQSLLANAEEFKLVKDQLERLLRFGNYTTVALSDPMTIPPLDNFLFGDFLEREGNRRHVKPPQEISNIVTKIEELMNRSVALNLINSMRDFALVRYFRTPTPSRLAKFKTALELAGCPELVDEISEDASSYTNMLERISSPAFSAKRKFLHFAIHAFFQDAYYDIIDKIKLMESRGEAVTGLLPSVTFLNPLHNYLDLHNCRLLALCLDEELSLEELPCLSGTALEAFVVNINKFNTITSEAFRVVKEISWYSSVGLPDLEKVTSFVISRDKNLMHVFLDGEYMIKMIDLDKLQKSAYGDSPHKHARVDKKNKRKGRLQEEDRQKAAPEPQTHETVDLKLGFSADRYSEFTMDLA